MIIDRHGMVAGKVSLIDITLVLVLVSFAIGFGYRRLSAPVIQVDNMNMNKKIYVTLLVEPLRQFSLDAINEGDIFFKQFEQQPMGTVAALRHEPAKAVIRHPNGISESVPMEKKYSLYITLECTGNLTSEGYFVNGSQRVVAGSELTIQSNMVVCCARIYSILDNLGEQ